MRDGKLTGEELAWTQLQLADAYRMDGRFAAAKKTAAELRNTLAARPKSEQTKEVQGIVERVDLLLVFIAGGERDCAGAACTRELPAHLRADADEVEAATVRQRDGVEAFVGGLLTQRKAL